MHGVTANDGPAALVMGVGSFAFGLAMILRPERVRANFDRFVEHLTLIVPALRDRNDYWKQGNWQPYKIPKSGLPVRESSPIRNSTPTEIEWLISALQDTMNGVLLPATRP